MVVRRDKVHLHRFAQVASQWGKAYFYLDGLKLSAFSTHQPDLQGDWILTTGALPMQEIHDLLQDELA